MTKKNSNDEVYPPKIYVYKIDDQLLVKSKKLMSTKYLTTFTVYGFQKKEDDIYYKISNNIYDDLKMIYDYMTEEHFELIGDKHCQSIFNKISENDTNFERAINIGNSIKNTDSLNIDLPTFKHRKLKNYQLKSVQHMIEVPNAANFSIPGSGKTTMVYAAFSKLKHTSKIKQLFVIGPLSSFKTWEDEYVNCFGENFSKHVIRYAGLKNYRINTLLNQLKKYSVVLMGLQTASSDIDYLKEIFFNNEIMLILDESHHIKSIRENAPWPTDMIELGKYAKKRIILSGTPMPYDWADLWSQITFLYPDQHVLSSRDAYKQLLESPNVEDNVSNKINFLWTRISHKQLKNDLPELKLFYDEIPMSPVQNEIYKILESDIVQLDGQTTPDIQTLYNMRRIRILRLLQCASNPGMILKKDIEFNLHPYVSDNSGIMEKLKKYDEVPQKIFKAVEYAMRLAEKDKNVIIWTVFRHNVDYICTMLKDMSPIAISGTIPVSVPDANIKDIITRDKLIEEFKNSKGRIMVATLGSIAESVSLHHNNQGEPVCQNAIYLERNFNAGQFLQSLFRLYRIGSDPKTPVHNTFLTSNFEDNVTKTVDDIVKFRLNERIKQMNRLLDGDRLSPLEISNDEQKLDNNENNLIYNKIITMIKNHQKKNKL